MPEDKDKPGSGGARYIAEQFVANLKDLYAGQQDDIKRLRDVVIPELYKELRKHGEDIAALKVKAGIWGFLGGLIPALAALIYFLARNAN